MIVRKLKDEEIKRCSELFHIAFEFQMTDKRSNEEMLKDIKETPKGRFDRFYTEKWAAFEDDDKTMMSSVIVTPYDVFFDTGVCKMSGMGGVSTLPQYRSCGGVRACFNASIKAMYDEDYAFSYLFPFSTGYYGKFGYAPCGENNSYSLSLKALKKNPAAGGYCRLVEKDYDYATDIDLIYRAFAKDVNMMCDRKAFDYDWVRDINPAVTGEYSYIYYSADKKPKGFLTFKKDETAPGHFDMACSRFFFADNEGFMGLCNLALSFGAYYEQLRFWAPSYIHIDMFIPEWALYKTERQVGYNGMVRVINVKKVLSMAKYIGAGNLKISVRDDILAQNDHTFLVDFSNGTANRISVTDERPDISMSIAEFSRFIVGSRDTADLYIAPDIAIHNDLPSLKQVFYKKRCLVMESF